MVRRTFGMVRRTFGGPIVAGKETRLIDCGIYFLTHEQLTLTAVDSTFRTTPQDEERVKKQFEEAKAKNPHFFDGTLWRYEGSRDVHGGFDMTVSPITYSWHNVLRHDKKAPMEYPNPLTVNAVQVTADGFMLIGVKGKIADQTGLSALGAGFIKRKLDKDGNNFPPPSPFSTVEDECKEETAYSKATAPFDREEMRFRGSIFGSSHDTTLSVYVPLHVTSKEVSLGNQEHSDMILLSTEKASLEQFLDEKGIKGFPAVDHLLGNVGLLHYNKFHLDRI